MCVCTLPYVCFFFFVSSSKSNKFRSLFCALVESNQVVVMRDPPFIVVVEEVKLIKE